MRFRIAFTALNALKALKSVAMLSTKFAGNAALLAEHGRLIRR